MTKERPIVDLHVHSYKSDGSLSPSDLVSLAVKKGLTAFALTDHDTVAGIDEAMEACEAYRKKGIAISVIPGIELSTEYQNRDIHIVGLMIDKEKREFKEKLEYFIAQREERNRKMCKKFEAFGIYFTYEDLCAENPNRVITRSHYAQYLWKHGYVSSVKEAFERYLSDRGPCFVKREKITPEQGVQLILLAGGIPVLAHPLIYGLGQEELQKLVTRLKAAGLVALEAIYSTYSASDQCRMTQLAENNGLLISGGSDFHGEVKPNLEMATGYGSLYIPLQVWTNLLKWKEKQDKKILFTDLDGTLLDGDSLVTGKMKRALDDFSKAGHTLVLTSGRPLNSILQVKKAAGIDYKGTYIIANNGSLFYDCDQDTVIKRMSISLADVQKVWKICDEMGIHVQSYDHDKIVGREWNRELQVYTSKIHLEILYDAQPWSIMTEEPCKMLAVELDSHEHLVALQERIRNEMGDRLQTVFSNPEYLEVFHKDAGKGAGLQWLCQYLQFPISASFAAGDAENDISMLQAAGTSIGMKNGDKKVKDIADIVTERTNREYGLADVIYEKILK